MVGRQEGAGTKAVNLTSDHKPSDEPEKRRIESRNGVCKPMYDPEFDEYIGPVRVWSRYYDCHSPGIAMSRSIGDAVRGARAAAAAAGCG